MMRRVLCFILLMTAAGGVKAKSNTVEATDTTSHWQTGVPEGKIEGPFMHVSLGLPGVEHEYWLYVPASYDSSKPAALLICLDGLNQGRQWNLRKVMDSLIHAGEMPITVTLFISPGVLPSGKTTAYDRPMRSVEYDSRSDDLVRMLTTEMLPLLEKKYQLADSPCARMIMGNSSGGHAAFNAAWLRPDVFSKVYSGVGSFTALRDGHEFPTLIRKTKPKPIRVFLQDGSKDLNNFSGDWWMANQYMLSSLQWAGYDVAHRWGDGGHNPQHGAAIMPEVLTWLWRDYPDCQPVSARKEREVEILSGPLEEWQRILPNVKAINKLVAGADNKLYVVTGAEAKTGRVQDEENAAQVFAVGKNQALLFVDETGVKTLYDSKKGKLVQEEKENKRKVISKDEGILDAIQTKDGVFYITDASELVFVPGISSDKTRRLKIPGHPSALTISSEKTFIAMGDKRLPVGYTVGIDTTGFAGRAVPFFHYHVDVGKKDLAVTSMFTDSQNQVYAATSMGIQVSDQLGRCQYILPLPNNAPIQSMACIDSTLYATDGSQLYRIQLRQPVAPSWAEPIRPVKPMHVKPLPK